MRQRKDDERDGLHESAQRTNLPLNDLMVRMLAQELPMVDSTSQALVMRELKAYEGPTITSQEELPAQIRELLDL